MVGTAACASALVRRLVLMYTTCSAGAPDAAASPAQRRRDLWIAGVQPDLSPVLCNRGMNFPPTEKRQIALGNVVFSRSFTKSQSK